jgi:hypothetical protein
LIETVIIVLIVLWLLGFFGARRGLRIPRASGNLVHILLVIALILIIVRLAR